MVKTTPLREDTHALLKDIQKALRNRYHINITIQDIVTHLLPNNEDAVENGVKKIIIDIKLDNTKS